MKIAVIVPTCRPASMVPWIAAWAEELKKTQAGLYVCHDVEELSSIEEHVRAIEQAADGNVSQYAWPEPQGCFSRKTDGIRCYGFLKAYHDGADIFITLDDDVEPAYPGVLRDHVLNLTTPAEQPAWEQVVHFRTRGIPFRSVTRSIPVHVNHGLWLGTPDLDAPTQLCAPGHMLYDKPEYGRVLATGLYAPLSAMNLAFTREMLPAFYFPPQGLGQSYDRFGDIWCGIIVKRICDHLHYGVRSGAPWVRHKRQSDPFANLIKEAPGTQANESFWHVIDSIHLASNTVAGCMDDIAYALDCMDGYYKQLGNSIHAWLSLL